LRTAGRVTAPRGVTIDYAVAKENRGVGISVAAVKARQHAAGLWTWRTFIVTEIPPAAKTKWAGNASLPLQKLPASGYLAISMLVSFSALPSTMPFTTTWCPRGRDFVLRVNGVNLFVALVHEDVLGAVLLHAPGGALRTAFLGIFRAAHVVGDPAVHEPSAGEAREAASRARAGKKKNRDFMESLLTGIESIQARTSSGSHNA